MDRIDLRIRARKKCKFSFKTMTSSRFYGKIKARKQLVFTDTEIRT